MQALPARARQHGFTLIELMIVVAVIGILAAVALPSFLDSVRKGRRAEGIAALTQVQQAQERWRANNAAYTTALAASAPNGLGIDTTKPDRLYNLSIGDASATGYTASATAVAGTSQASDSKCHKLVLRLTGGNIFYESVDAGGTDSTATGRCWVR